MPGEFKRAVELLMAMANIARARGNEEQARTLEEGAHQIQELANEEPTDRTKVIVCQQCARVIGAASED